jgi:DNA polymerase-4
VTVKIKWSDFHQATPSQYYVRPVDSQKELHEPSLDLIRAVFPSTKGVRLVGVALSNFRQDLSEAATPLLSAVGAP